MGERKCDRVNWCMLGRFGGWWPSGMESGMEVAPRSLSDRSWKLGTVPEQNMGRGQARQPLTKLILLFSVLLIPAG